MGLESDQQYFSRRYEEETSAADIAANREARVAHLELAARYAQMAAAIREVDERIGASFGPMDALSSAATEHSLRVTAT